MGPASAESAWQALYELTYVMSCGADYKRYSHSLLFRGHDGFAEVWRSMFVACDSPFTLVPGVPARFSGSRLFDRAYDLRRFGRLVELFLQAVSEIFDESFAFGRLRLSANDDRR
jgi:hypothetical protein